MTQGTFRSLNQTLTRKLVAVSLLCTALAIAVQLSWVYATERAAFDAQVRLISQTHLRLLSTSLWDMETREVQGLIESIVTAPQISYAVLNATTGQVFKAGEYDHSTADHPSGDVKLSVFGPGPNPQRLGELSIDFNHDYLRSQLTVGAVQVTVISGLLTLMLGLFNSLTVRRKVLEPMRELANFAVELAPGKLSPPLRLSRNVQGQDGLHHSDEIDRVAEGFATLQQEIERYVSERRQHEAQLAQQAELLEITVKQRTAELRSVNRYLEQISACSSRFLNVSVEEYPTLLRHTLQELIQPISGCDMVVAEQLDSASPLLLRFVWQNPNHGLQTLRENTELPKGLLLPLPPGWSHERISSLDQVGPERAEAMRSLGARAMAYSAYKSQDSSRFLIALSVRPQSWVGINDRLTQMAADMVFSSMRQRRDQVTMMHLHRELQQLSHTDPLTGLANRRHFDEVKIKETRRALRMGLPLAVVCIDIDHFKSFNDTYGHAHGDACLSAVAREIAENFHRAGELTARLGGEEFTVLLPGQTLEEAAEHAERLRQRVLALAMPHEVSPLAVVSVSIGIACLDGHRYRAMDQAPPPEALIAQVLEAADRALYFAKRNGRNRVHAAAS